MRRVIFTLIKNNSAIVYPDDISLFSNTEIIGSNMTADYSGNDVTILDAPPTVITLTMTSLSSDDVNEITDGLYEITCVAGSTLTFNATADYPINEKFRMPFTNGSETRYALAEFVNGKTTVTTLIDKSGLWMLTEEEVNKSLSGLKFKMNTVKAYIVQ